MYESDRYSELCGVFNLPPLSLRRKFLDLCFVYKCVNSRFICPDILDKFNFYVPPRCFRFREFFRLPNHRMDLSKHAFVSRSMRLLNSLYPYGIDLFTSFADFKNELKELIYTDG